LQAITPGAQFTPPLHLALLRPASTTPGGAAMPAVPFASERSTAAGSPLRS
jgi:hypothetical protein